MPTVSKYRAEYHDDWAWSLSLKGATDEEMAQAFGISRKTLYTWRQKHESFNEAIERGKNVADSKVERSLYERAIGFETTDTEKTIDMDKDGNPKPVRIKNTTRKIVPDTMAIMYWLNNRKRGQWSQRQEVALSAADDSEDVVIYLPAIDKDDGEDV